MSDYVPDEGEIVWIQLSPTVGREQTGHRPAVVLTKAEYNGRTGMMFCVPLTSRIKNYPFEVAVGSGVALVDHSRAVDWKARGLSRKGAATPDEMQAMRAKLHKLVG